MHLTNKSIQSGYYGWASNPFVLQLERDTNDYEDDWLFQQVVVKITISEKTYELSALATDIITMDISSAYRAYFSKASEEVNLPYLYGLENIDVDEPLSSTVQVYKKYFVDGVEYSYKVDNIGTLVLYVLRGGVDEFKRWNWGQQHANNILHQYAVAGGGSLMLTEKPAEVEVRGAGDRMAVAQFTNKDGLAAVYTQVMDVEDLVGSDESEDESDGDASDTLRVCVDEDESRREFVLENRYGVIETCSAKTLEAASNEVDSTGMVLRGEPSFKPNNQYMSKNVVSPGEWAMSSGYVSLAQAKWWLGEFCGASHVYMKLSNGKLLPVTISLKKVQLYDRTANVDLPHVDFTVTSGLSGNVEL